MKKIILFSISFFVISTILGMSANPKYFTTSSDYHIVEKGENLQSVSEKYSLPKERLKLFNGLKHDKIYVGQKLYLYPKQVKKSEFITERKIPKTGYHIVKPNESIHRIAKMYDVSVFDILEFNNLASYKIKTGSKIMLKSEKKEIPKQQIIQKQETEKREKQVTKPKEKKLEKKDKIKQNLFIPVKGEITSEFGMRNGRPHRGIDIAASKGDPIHACLAGKIVFVGTQRGYGNVIIIEHENFVMSVYAHNETNFVRLGEIVKKGQPIATVGETGIATGPHLHFEYRVKGKAINPREILPKI